MLEFFWDTVLPLVGTFTVGVLGWFCAHYVADPILRLSQLRREILESIFATKNIHKGTREERRDAASAELRRLAARLDALLHTSWLPIKSWWTLRGYDLALAVSGLTGLSNSLSDERGEKASCRHDVEKGLRFPLEHTVEQIRRIRARSEAGAVNQVVS